MKNSPPMFNAFTEDGSVPASGWFYFAQRYSGQAALVSLWMQEMPNRLVAFHRVGRQVSGILCMKRDAFMKIYFEIRGQCQKQLTDQTISATVSWIVIRRKEGKFWSNVTSRTK
jgi:hypothetical protein